ncbi:MAG: 50S ribosomal protein L24 [Candidatus Synoicihabitans palmerolidicus]|nr:50S ribosomal protein L24 [Candidatus Synoicihabitans palmerolidicus]
MKKFHIKRGDEVAVIAGAHKGKTGNVLEILTSKDRVRVEGVAMIKRHMKKTQEGESGGIIEREGSVHISNLMLKSKFDTSTKRPTAVATA